MAGAMFAPAVALVPLLWLGAIAGDALLVLDHLAMFPLMFLVMLRRRQATWPAIAIGFALVAALQALDVLAPPAGLTAVALVVLVWGAVDGQLRRPDPFRVQALGMVGSPWPGWPWTPTWAATWWPPAGSCTASGTSPTSSSTRS
jgi:hypothetical protein